MSWPSPASEQHECETCALSPGPSPKFLRPRSSTHDSWNNSWIGISIVTNGLTSGRVVTMATDGFVAGTCTTTAITERTLGESATLVMSINTTTTTTRPMLGTNVNLMMSGMRVTEKRAAGARVTGRRADGTTQTGAVMIAKNSSGQVILSSRQ